MRGGVQAGGSGQKIALTTAKNAAGTEVQTAKNGDVTGAEGEETKATKEVAKRAAASARERDTGEAHAIRNTVEPRKTLIPALPLQEASRLLG